MVNSVLDPTIIYTESKTINKEDKNFAAQVYEISLFAAAAPMVVHIVLGQPKYTFSANNIVYYPIYLTLNDEDVLMQIGVYEVPADTLPTLIDDDGDIDLDLLDPPLMFAFTTLALIKQLREPANKPSPTEAEQTEETALKERQDFKKNSKPLWIQKFLENSNYKIVENEGKGECLFAVIRDGLKGKKEISVEQMRQMLAKEVDEELFLNYLTLYLDAQEQDKIYLEELKGLVQRNNVLKERLAKEKDRNKQMAIITSAEEIKKRHEEVSEQRKTTRFMLNEFSFMKGIKDLAGLKAKIQTCEFWGNTWAVSTLERLLNIKLILLSEENYKAGDLDNVLQCGQLNDDKLGETFEPIYYILTCFQGWHYQLITYKNKGALAFNDIPYDIKMLVVSKCLERLAGPYYIIPAFRDFLHTSLAEEGNKESLAELTQNLSEEIQTQTELYDTKTVFQFYYKSFDKPLPGHGVGEKINISDEKNGMYKDLAKIKSWRKKLANEWEAPFKLDGHVWQTVEHYYQGSKFKKEHPDFYLKFSLDSGSDISKDPFVAHAVGEKSGTHALRPKEVSIDKDFFLPTEKDKPTRSEKEMESAVNAKFTQNPELLALLKATKNAKLQQFRRGLPPIVLYELMRVRNNTF
jgi:predicted NAD-dependent protein-ADP-ribosyltransferase YbiA (DUF1768 family)